MEANVETKNELALLVEKSGLQSVTAQILREKFEPFIQQAAEWNEKSKSLVVTDATQLTEMRQAREARLSLRGIRIAISDTHKELKADSLKYSQTLDAIKRTLTAMIEPTEEYLQQQEDFAKIAEEKRKSELASNRLIELQKYGFQYNEGFNLGEMAEPLYQNLLTGTKKAYEDKIAAEKKAEEERIAKEKSEAEELARIKAENDRLKEEAEAREKELAKERAAAEKAKAESEAKAKKEREAAEAKLEEERRKAKEENDRIRKEAEERERKECEARELAEAELKSREAELNAKKEAEAKRIADEKAAEERRQEEIEAAKESELAKGDADKLTDLIADLEAIKTKYQFKSKKHNAIYADVKILLDKVINHATSKA